MFSKLYNFEIVWLILKACQSIWGYFMPIWRIRNCIHYTFIFLWVSFFCTLLYGIKYLYLIQVICKQIYLSHRWDYQVLPFQVRVDPGVMPMKGYARTPELWPHHHMQFNVILLFSIQYLLAKALIIGRKNSSNHAISFGKNFKM